MHICWKCLIYEDKIKHSINYNIVFDLNNSLFPNSVSVSPVYYTSYKAPDTKNKINRLKNDKKIKTAY